MSALPPLVQVPLPEVIHHNAGGVEAKETHIPAGMVLVQHKHQYDHLSVLASGVVELEVDGVRVVHEGPKLMVIKAGSHHAVKALTDAVWFCIHSEDVALEEALSIEQSRDVMQSIAAGMLR